MEQESVEDSTEKFLEDLTEELKLVGFDTKNPNNDICPQINLWMQRGTASSTTWIVP